LKTPEEQEGYRKNEARGEKMGEVGVAEGTTCSVSVGVYSEGVSRNPESLYTKFKHEPQFLVFTSSIPSELLI
jgi:hypothetical protein